ncbi:hypothetical protein tb265_30440 [Gemmatimonadetes bacterium T265]|nr:hypothetical protein tb265_30440 [Gemmatimonadetes bacterium T265]
MRRSLDALGDAGVPVLDLAVRSLFDPRPVLRLAAYLRREAVEVLHTHNRYAHLVGRPAAALAGRPVVSTDHWIVETDAGLRGAVRCRLDDLSARVFRGDMVMVSRAQRRAHEAMGRLRGARVTVIPNGIDTAAFRPDPEVRRRVRSRLGIPDDAPVLIAVAMLRPGKGHDHLLAAVARLRGAVPGLRLLVVGDGGERAALECRSAALGLSDAVTFLGTRGDVGALLAAADVYAHPSLFESLPTSILEAMAAGLPVVACAVGGVPELVTDGATGFLVPAADPGALAAALARALQPGAAARLGGAGRAWVEMHGAIGPWVDRHAALYEAARRRARGA